MWFKWFKNYPVRYKVMGLSIAYCFGILGFITGMIFWIISKFRNVEALVLAIAGLAVFVFFYWLIRASAEFEGPDDVPKDEQKDC